MNRYSSERDLSMVQRHPMPSPQTHLLWMCGHKGGMTGGVFRGRVPWRCAACAAKKD